MSFNTVVGNFAYPNPDSGQNRPLPGPAIMMYNYPGDSANQLTHNNILGNDVGGLFDEHGQPISEYDLYLSNYQNTRKDMIATQNYWGTTDLNTIKYDITYDYDNDFAPGTAYFQPFLTAPEPLAPGFLWQATTHPPDPIGAEVMTVTLDFSRDMNTAITPTVTFGVDEPYTQNRIESGQWASPTRWVGAYQVEIWTGDGINTLKVSDAEDTDGMPIPEDTRFQFVIQVAGTSAMLLEGNAGLGYAHLTWPESDIEDLAGYVIYRSPLTNTNYSPIATLLSTTYTDTKVINSQLYYYKYAILNTDFEETAESNEIALVPDDFSDPTTPVVTDDGAWTHLFTQLHATWSAQDPETGIVEYQYCIGTAVGACDTVGWTSLGLATEVTKTGLNLQDGETYYFNVKARNGAGHWSGVGSSDGITVDKLPAPTIGSVAPESGVRAQSHVITISGSNFATPTVKLDSTFLGGVVMNTSDWLSATVPSGIAAGVYTLTVTNYDTQWAMLSDAYTATNPAHAVAPVSVSPASGAVGTDEASYTVNIEVGTVSDLGHFQFDLLFEPAVVQVSSVNLGWFLGSAGRSTATVGPDINNTTGIVTFGGYSYGSNPGASGSGTLATVTFTPAAQGSSAFTLQNVQLIDTVSGVIPVQLNDGQVQVVVYPAYDFDRDCEITVLDIMQVASRWNTHTSDPGYDPAFDLDSDGDIDIADIAMVANTWGETCSGGVAAQAAVGMAATGPALRLLPERATPRPGDLLTFELTVSDVAGLGAYQVMLEYDPTSLDVVEVQPGPMLAATGNSVVNLKALGEGGQVSFGAFSYGDQPGATGDGILARITLRVLKPGEHALALRRAYLVDMDARSLALSEMGGAVVDAGYRLHLPLLRTQR